MWAGVNILGVTSAKSSYHHGDLRNALVQAGADLAEQGGPAAVTIRAAARAVGVTPTAAYRHFTDHAALLDAVCDLAMARLTSSMTRYLRTVTTGDDAGETAVRRLEATGRGYVSFAIAEPGLFRTAFSKATVPEPSAGTEHPFALLMKALDELVAAGSLSADDRPLAEFGAWSAVHGLAVLLVEGPLRGLRRRERDAVIQKVLDMVKHGIAGTPQAR
jgi:AcrR family transcriptional regulator